MKCVITERLLNGESDAKKKIALLTRKLMLSCDIRERIVINRQIRALKESETIK